MERFVKQAVETMRMAFALREAAVRCWGDTPLMRAACQHQLNSYLYSAAVSSSVEQPAQGRLPLAA